MDFSPKNKFGFSSKLPNLGTTIFTVMSTLAQKEGAINLSQGFPDFDCDAELIDLVASAMKKGANQYAPMAGIMPLREAIAEKTESLYGVICDPQKEVTVTSGASEAIFNVIAAVIRAGDEVVIFEPAYDLYQPVIELYGGKVVPVSLQEDYCIDWEEAGNAVSEKTKLIIVNTPHNPSGMVLKEKDLQRLEALIRDTSILVLSDEVYEHIIFDNLRHQSVLRYPALRERSFVVSSFGKTFHATGWKIGYCIAPPYLSEEFRKIHQYNTFATFTPAQWALASFLKQPAHYLDLSKFYQTCRDQFRKLMQDTPFRLLPCEGTYFQLVSYRHLSAEKDIEYARRITKEAGVASIPLSPFYNQGTDRKVIRFCFAKKYDTMEKAVERLLRNKSVLEG